ncbi:MAG TPA: hypothetical protein PKA99_13650 [Dermatophilaceae bacterium]|nr:hypothetical protein [Dermatophilaceae bacterium]
MPTTPALAIPYPPPTGVAPDVPYHLQQTAERLEAILTNRTWSPPRIGWDLKTASALTVATATVVQPAWDVETTDTDNFHATSATSVTIPAALGGIYLMTLTATTNPPASLTGRCFLDISAAGANYRLPFGSGDDRASLTVAVALAGSTQVNAALFHSSGANRSFDVRFSGWRVSA